MKTLRFLIESFRCNSPMIWLVFIVSAVFISMVLFLHFWRGVPIPNMTRDPLAVVNAPIYTGFLSQIGILFWSYSAAICLFCAKVMPKNTGNAGVRLFLFISGLLTLVLCLDDSFQLHEIFFPHIGLPQKIIFLGYFLMVFFWLVIFHEIILKTEYNLLVMALFFFGLSIIIDELNLKGIELHIFEDGAKLVGIVSWLVYFFRTGVFALNYDSTQQDATAKVWSGVAIGSEVISSYPPHITTEPGIEDSKDQ